MLRKRIEQNTEHGIGVLARFCQNYARSVVAGFLLLSVLAGWYTAGHLAINTDTTEMLAADLPWRITYAEYKAAFPFFSDTIVVVVDAATPDLGQEAATRLSEALDSDKTHFNNVFNPAADPYLIQQQLLYLAPDELESLLDDLSSAQAFLGRLAADPGLNGLLALLTELLERGEEVTLPRLGQVLDALAIAVREQLAGDPVPMSWQSILAGNAVQAPTRVVFTVQPLLDYASILPAQNAIDALRSAVHTLGYDVPEAGVRVRLTGGAALGYDELSSVVRGAEQAGLLAFVAVGLCLLVGLRSAALVVATLLSLVVGLIFTACFATLAVGTLNMISIAFAVLYVGLGVDFAIHVCLRYRELCHVQSKHEAITSAIRHVGISLTLCALTTAIAFFAFLPTSYRGVAELGLISGCGILLGLVISLTLLPALLKLLPAPDALHAHARVSRALQWAAAPKYTRPVLCSALVCAAGAAVVVPGAYFDSNPLNLNDQNAESVQTFVGLDHDGSMSAITALLSDAESARAAAARLARLDAVRTVVTPADLLPADQDEKLAFIDDLRFTLGAALEISAASPVRLEATQSILADLRAKIAALPANGEQAENFAGLAAELTRLADKLATEDKAAAGVLLAALEHKLMHHFPDQVVRLGASLEAEAMDFAALPAAVKNRWQGPRGHWRLEVLPPGPLRENAPLAHFVTEVRRVLGPAATGAPVINFEAARAVTGAFYQAFTTAVLLIAALLYAILRRTVDVLVVLAPLALAALLTTAAAVIFAIPFNFANIIALPLLMGIGVDSALHMLHRYKTTGADDVPLLASSSARAVLFSALTTTASFGNLAFSPHAGTASMGAMLTIGLITTLLSTLIVLPALLRRFVTVTGSMT